MVDLGSVVIHFGALNYIAIGVLIVTQIVLGGLWYSPPVFGNPYLAEIGKTQEDVAARGGAVQGLGATLGASIVSVFSLAIVIQLVGATDSLRGLLIGLIAGVAFVAASNASHHIFEGRPLKLFLINAGYPVVTMATWSVVLALWR